MLLFLNKTVGKTEIGEFYFEVDPHSNHIYPAIVCNLNIAIGFLKVR